MHKVRSGGHTEMAISRMWGKGRMEGREEGKL